MIQTKKKESKIDTLEEKNKAQQLRNQGFSIKQIAKTLRVSKGSVSTWVRNIEIPNDLLSNIENQRRLARERARKTRLFNIFNRVNDPHHILKCS